MALMFVHFQAKTSHALKRSTSLLCIVFVALHTLACTIGGDDQANNSTVAATSIRLDVTLAAGLTLAQVETHQVEVWLHDLDDSALDRTIGDRDQIDTALQLLSRGPLQDLIQGQDITTRLSLDIDLANLVSNGNNLVVSVLLFAALDSATPTFISRGGLVSFPADFGSTQDMTLDAAEIVEFAEVTVAEEEGIADFVATRTPSSSQSITLNSMTQDGTSAQFSPALAGEDYVSDSAGVRFGPDEVDQTLTISILDDALPEGTETYNVLLELDVRAPLSNRAFIAGGLNGGTFGQVVGMITDRDPVLPPALGLRLEALLPSMLSAAQAANLMLEVWLHDLDDSPGTNGVRDRDQVDTALLIQSRASVLDLVLSPPIVDRLTLDIDLANIVSSGDNLVVSILIFPDASSALPTFIARAGLLAFPGDLGTISNMVLGPSEVVQFGDATVEEGAGNAVFSGMLSPGSTRAVVLNITAQDGTSPQFSPARVGQDYENTNGNVRFEPGETVRDIVIPILNDDDPEPTESFNVLLEVDIRFPANNRTFINGGLNGGTFDFLVGTITDTDVAP